MNFRRAFGIFVFILFVSVFVVGLIQKAEQNKENYVVVLYSGNGKVLKQYVSVGKPYFEEGFIHFTDVLTGEKVQFSGTIVVEKQ